MRRRSILQSKLTRRGAGLRAPAELQGAAFRRVTGAPQIECHSESPANYIRATDP